MRKLDALSYTLYALHSTLYALHSTLYALRSTLYTLHSTLYTLHSTLYTLHSTLYTLHSIPACNPVYPSHLKVLPPAPVERASPSLYTPDAQVWPSLWAGCVNMKGLCVTLHLHVFRFLCKQIACSSTPSPYLLLAMWPRAQSAQAPISMSALGTRHREHRVDELALGQQSSLFFGFGELCQPRELQAPLAGEPLQVLLGLLRQSVRRAQAPA